jgi:hypothetical protein
VSELQHFDAADDERNTKLKAKGRQNWVHLRAPELILRTNKCPFKKQKKRQLSLTVLSLGTALGASNRKGSARSRRAAAWCVGKTPKFNHYPPQ